MKFAVIAIGDELLIGQVTDTNSGYIAREIAKYGWSLSGVQVVGDNAQAILCAIDRALDEADIVITTGGLGPTKDDITKEVLRQRFGGEMVENADALRNVKVIFERRGLELNKLTLHQALVPSSARITINRVGTAPIMWFEQENQKVLIAMPGVPAEMEYMFSHNILPEIIEQHHHSTHESLVYQTLILEGISESKLATQLSQWEDNLDPALHLAYLPMSGYLRLRLDGHHKDSQQLSRLMLPAVEELKRRCGNHLLWEGNLTPAEILLKRLEQLEMTVATAESCTGGNIAHLIIEIPGASAAMHGGVVAYSNDVKMNVLGVKADTLAAHGAVSEQVVEEMAQGVRKVTGSDVGIATSGIAGPTGATEGKPVGTVCIAVATPHGVISKTWHFKHNRAQVIERASNAALIMAIRAIESHKSEAECMAMT